MKKKFQVGDLVVQDCTMPYPGTIYRVEELDEYENFRGPAVFRLTDDEKCYPTRKGQWLGRGSFRVIGKDELQSLVRRLVTLVDEG